MTFDRAHGRYILFRYLGDVECRARYDHSIGVGDFASAVADRIKRRHPELVLEPEFIRFLGYAHDIGYKVADAKHEVHTVELLKHEGLPLSIARMAMHGQLVEQFGSKEGNVEQYLPVGLEGMILTFSDMSVRTGGIIPMEERAAEIVARIVANPAMPAELKQDIIANLHAALPRFRRYEGIVLALVGASSVTDFHKP